MRRSAEPGLMGGAHLVHVVLENPDTWGKARGSELRMRKPQGPCSSVPRKLVTGPHYREPGSQARAPGIKKLSNKRAA